MLILLKDKFQKYGMYKPGINDRATSAFGGIYVESTESTTPVKYEELPIYRRNSQNAIILVKLVQVHTPPGAF